MRFLPIFALTAALAGCVGPAAPPPQPETAVAVPRPAPPPAPLAADWRDWPLTPGDWRYAAAASGSTASFGAGATPALVLRCDLASRRVRIERPGTPAGAMTLRTTSVSRAIATDGTLPNGAWLSASDPLLDAMGFSRGRFLVEQSGQPTLVLPAWAEIGRVTEDCRR